DWPEGDWIMVKSGRMSGAPRQRVRSQVTTQGGTRTRVCTEPCAKGIELAQGDRRRLCGIFVDRPIPLGGRGQRLVEPPCRLPAAHAARLGRIQVQIARLVRGARAGSLVELPAQRRPVLAKPGQYLSNRQIVRSLRAEVERLCIAALAPQQARTEQQVAVQGF